VIKEKNSNYINMVLKIKLKKRRRKIYNITGQGWRVHGDHSWSQEEKIIDLWMEFRDNHKKSDKSVYSPLGTPI